MRPRIAQELDLLRRVYGDLEHIEEAGEDWICLPCYPVPKGWRISGGFAVRFSPCLLSLSRQIILVYGSLRFSDAGWDYAFEGSSPEQYRETRRNKHPSLGEWLHFSWSAEDWSAGTDACQGSNLVAWCHSFSGYGWGKGREGISHYRKTSISEPHGAFAALEFSSGTGSLPLRAHKTQDSHRSASQLPGFKLLLPEDFVMSGGRLHRNDRLDTRRPD